MRYRFVIALGLVSAIAAPAAYAFQEQADEGPPAAQESAPKADAGAQKPAAELGGAPAQKAAEGTEVTIPGFGTLGVLPKMDFGLELLYGAEGAKPEGAQEPEANPEGDLTIRGSVKHKF